MTLTGKRVLVTRSVEQAGELASLVRAAGGVPVLFPTIRMMHPEDCGPLDRAIERLSTYDGILFTSANAARFFCDRAKRPGAPAWPADLRVACVGPGTAKELAARGVPVALVAGKHTAEGLFEALRSGGVRGKRFLLPGAEEGRDTLPEAIAGAGGVVESVVAYRNGPADGDEATAAEIVARPPDVCTFASPSAFRNLFVLLGEEAAARMLRRSRIAVIGEVTARAVERREFRVDIVPETYTLKGMVDAVRAFFAAQRSAGPA
ncbi:MAG: hypothetical protein OHK0028_13800 [Deltaproteobacteria bacterium]